MEKRPDVDPSLNKSNTGVGFSGVTSDQRELLKIGEISAEIKHEKDRIAVLRRKLRMESLRRRLKKRSLNATDIVAEFFTALIHSSTTPAEEAETRRRLQRDMSRRNTTGTTL